MKDIKTFNDVPSLYEEPLIYRDDGTIECPVCHKEYKREKSAIKHYEKQDCYNAVDVFKDTPYESYAFDLYEQIVYLKNSRAYVSKKTFRKSPSYRLAIQFILTCFSYEIPDIGEYYIYLKEVEGMNKINLCLSKGTHEDKIHAYRFYRHKNGLIESRSFYDKYKEELTNDEEFLLESIIKSNISVTFVSNSSTLMNVVENMPIGYRIRLQDYLEQGDL